MDDDIRVADSAPECTDLLQIGGIGGINFVGLALQSASRVCRRNQARDIEARGTKKIRASSAGVSTTGDQDARMMIQLKLLRKY